MLLGEQRRDADVVIEDADVDVIDADDEVDAVDADSDADVDADEEMTCYQAMFCLVACGEDLLCAAECAGRVCESSRAAFDEMSECALPLCAPDCSDLSSSACQSCLFDNCSGYLAVCVGAGC